MLQITNRKKFFSLIAISLLVLLFIFKFIWGSSVIQKSGDLKVESGTSAKKVGQALEAGEYINGTLPWRFAVWRSGATSSLQAGTYRLEAGETISKVVDRMSKGEVVPDELTITYPEGFTLQQIAARTAARRIGTEGEFISTAVAGNFSDEFEFLQDLPKGHSLEGYLFPDTYRVFADDTSRDVIARMLANFNQKVTADIRAEAKNQNRSLYDVVKMASIIEREVNRKDDLAKVADVLWKRVDDQTGLYADATIRYILNKWDGALTVQDLAIDSPYNTRRYRDLPPTPIGNPGLSVILAALRPEKTDFYYYLSAPDGTTIFAKTNDEHNRNKAQYLK